MVTYDLLEDSIVAKLVSLTPVVQVECLPDTPAQTDKPFSKSRVTVAYRSSDFSKEVVRGLPQMRSTGPSIQDEFSAVEVVIQARRTRGANGVHDIAGKIRSLLLNFTPPNWSRLTLESYKFIDHDKDSGLFSYAYTFLTQTVFVPDVQTENDTPVLENLTFDS